MAPLFFLLNRETVKIKERLSLAAIHMKDANIGLAFKSLSSGLGGASPLTVGSVGPMHIDVGGDYSFKHFLGNSTEEIRKSYFNCPPLAAIINRKAQEYTNGKTWVLTAAGKSKGEVSQSPAANKLRNLLSNPNPLQTWKQFEAQNYIYTQLFGYCPVLIMRPVGFENIDAKMMWNLPPHMCEIEEDTGPFYARGYKGIKRFTFSYGGATVDIDPSYIFIFKDIMPSFSTVLLPDSRVNTLVMPINNIIGAYESRNMLINSRGALGMITNKTKDSFSAIPLKPGDKEELYAEFQKLYGLRRGQAHVIISSADLAWQSMVLPTKDLMLFEEIEDSANRICDTFMFPKELLANMGKGTTYSNMATSTRNLYQGAIIPEAGDKYEQWNKLFETEKYNLILDRDYSHLSALQADAKMAAEARLRRAQAFQIEFRNNVITLNQWRIANNEDPVKGGDVYYSDIKDMLEPEGENIEDTHVEDNINPREGNDGTPGEQA